MEDIMTKENVTLNAKQESFAQALFNAYQNHQPLKMADWDGVVTDDDTAYAVQDRFAALKKLPTGGYKVSLTSKKTQDMFDSDCPLYGQQVDSHFLPSPALLSLKKQTMDPLLEVELGFRATEDLKPDDSLEDLLHKTTVCGTVELPDCRFTDWFPDLNKFNVMSDCAVGGFVVYGLERPADKVFATVEDAANVNVTLYHNGQKQSSGQSSEVLGNPFKSLSWLVGKLAEQGKEFRTGQLVSSGTFLLPPHLTKGVWTAKFDHGFGDVTVNVND
ncbi:2-oxo-hept-3-ene-1,7-dioate hydratase [Limosilactobacillus panis DSM 6035]|uniref:2-oxo-hept-3-ene-1,7-dioate hydratase n=2 Tax=Lactobacillaceae TaxID=33958 RepID=A0A0R1XHX6_9LACO|nr:2-oxo-hept-3-ene-1,7-dioate hydratase [Limosilactobacillus panis DSM 6035]